MHKAKRKSSSIHGPLTDKTNHSSKELGKQKKIPPSGGDFESPERGYIYFGSSGNSSLVDNAEAFLVRELMAENRQVVI